MGKPKKYRTARRALPPASSHCLRSLRCESLEERRVMSVNPVLPVAVSGGSDTIAMETAQPVHDLGQIDSSLIWTAEEASTGEVYHQVQATRDALLTLEGLPRKAHHEIKLTLYDADFQVLDTSMKVGDNFRVEWDALAGETYYFTIEAPAVTEVTVLNAIAIDDTQVTVFGTSGEDSCQIGDAQGNSIIVFNGIEYEIDRQTVHSFAYQGNGGGDTVSLFDSSGNDTFHSRPGEVVAWNDTGTWTVQADGYSTLHVYSMVGGQDTAFLYDSVGSDKFKAEPGVAKMLRHGDYYNRVKGFSQVRGLSTNGGNDVALLQGTDGDDQLTAQQDETRIVGQSYDVSARGFGSTTVWAMGGHDVAVMTDSALDDTVRARSHKVNMWAGDASSPEYEIVARGFDYVSLLATEGGYDKAKLHDSVFDDLLELGDGSARMNLAPGTLDVVYEAFAFEWIKAYSTSENDTVSGAEDAHDYETVLDGEWHEK